jgi:hypothetical protein
MVVVWVRLPDWPVMVTVAVPAEAELLTVKLTMLVEVVLLGLKDAVTPPGSPEADRLTLPEKPLAGFTVMVALRPAPCWMLNAPGAQESVKPDAAVLVRPTPVLAFKTPEVPVTVMLKVPVAALLFVVRLSVLVEAVVVGLNDAVTPVGIPVAARLTLPEKPLAGTTVIVLWPLAPWSTLTLAGEGESVKLGGRGGGPEEAPPQPAAIRKCDRITKSENAFTQQVRQKLCTASGLADFANFPQESMSFLSLPQRGITAASLRAGKRRTGMSTPSC